MKGSGRYDEKYNMCLEGSHYINPLIKFLEEIMLIEKDNIIIRSADIKDAEVLNSWWNDGEIMEHAGFPNGLGESLETTRANLEKTNPFYYLCIIEIDNKKVGECSFGLKDNTAYPGWKICEKTYQNKGYGPKIINILIEYLFTNSDINSKMKIKKYFGILC